MAYVNLENSALSGYSKDEVKEAIHKNCILAGKLVFYRDIVSSSKLFYVYSRVEQRIELIVWNDSQVSHC